MKQYRRGDLTFDYIDDGPADGPVVVLLHGFPQLNTSWNAVIDRLTARGYRCIAPNQRGYSPGARPKRRRDYRAQELVEDVRALLDAVGAQRVHLVGHDWGAAVAWGAADELSDRVATLTSFSVPHPTAFTKALVTSRQGLASWYMYFFQLPWLPERLLLGADGKGVRAIKSLQSGGQTHAAAERDVKAMAEPGALTAALNWYRAMFLEQPAPWGRKDFRADDVRLERRGHRADRQTGTRYRRVRQRGIPVRDPARRLALDSGRSTR